MKGASAWTQSLVVAACLVGLMTAPGCSSTPIVQPLRPQVEAAVPSSTSLASLASPVAAVTSAAAATSAVPSLPQFLGIPQLFRGAGGLLRTLRDRIAARLGKSFPGIEPKPPLKLLTDPANLSPEAPPSVQAAADIKKKEDESAQKEKAVEYLATVGCGCYEGVAEALAESLKDCNEGVRYATVKALRELGSKPCSCCGGQGCCTVEIHKELMRLAWEMDADGCYVERSPRVRRVARLALQTCCSPTSEVSDEKVPQEGPLPDTLDAPPAGPTPAPAPAPAPAPKAAMRPAMTPAPAVSAANRARPPETAPASRDVSTKTQLKPVSRVRRLPALAR